MEKIIDVSDCIAGRVASEIAKMLLKGDVVSIVNSELAIVSGNPVFVEKDYKEKVGRGDPYHGPFYPRRPDMVLKRIIRGMLPIKKAKGRDALKRVKVYISVPEELKKKKAIKLKGTENSLKCKYKTLGDISVSLGVKKTW